MSTTPVFEGANSRASGTGDVVVSSYTSTADHVQLAWIITNASGAPSAPTGHGTWSQLGSTETASNAGAGYLYGCVSTGATSVVTVANSNTNVMSVQVCSVPDLDVSSGVSSAYKQLTQYNATSTTSFTQTFATTVTNTTIGFYGGKNGGSLTPENTALVNTRYRYVNRQMIAFNLAGDDTPSATCSSSTGVMFMIELIDAGGSGPQTLSPTAIASEEGFGTPVITGSDVTLSPTAIASAESFGASTITVGGVTLSPGAIASAEAFGNPVLSTGVVQLQPSAIASAEAFGTPVISVGAVILSPDGIASEEGFGVAFITGGTPPVILDGLTKDLTFDLTVELTRDITGA